MAAKTVGSIPQRDYNFPPELIQGHSFFVLPMTESEILNIIDNLKTKHSRGVCGYSSAFLKEFKHNIFKPLTYIINQSLTQGHFPDFFKIAIVKPLLKKGNPRNIENYRPISLLSTISKVFEYSMLLRLHNYLKAFNILRQEQHGFCRDKSTATAIMSFYECLLDNLDKKNASVALFCDLSKAFDCVAHALLLEKLDKYGIRGVPHRWFRSYLENRQQCVKIDCQECMDGCQISSTRAVTCGVPQGSVLGPILFIIFLNDLPVGVGDCSVTMYADDASILIAKPDIAGAAHALNQKLEVIHSWFSGNKLFLNLDKTHFVYFHTYQDAKQFQFDVRAGGVHVGGAASVNFLGVRLDETLCWSEHCSAIVSKLNTCIYQLKLLRSCISPEMLRQVYFSVFESRLRYGLLLWGVAPAAERVFLAQKRAVRCLAGASFGVSCRHLFVSLHILTLTSLYILEAACHIHKVRDTLVVHGGVHAHDTRNSGKIVPPFCRLDLKKNSYLNNGIKIYNKLPSCMKKLNHRHFKARLRAILTDLPFYGLDEFHEHDF